MEPRLNTKKRHRFDFTLSVEVCAHAIFRMEQRLTMEPEALLRIINEGRAICLTNPFSNAQNRGRYLFYSAPDSNFFVAVIAISETSKTGLIITILTREQHERDIGKSLEIGSQKRAAQSVLAPKEYADWVAKHFPPPKNAVNQTGKFKNVRLSVEYWDENGRRLVFISNPPISADELRSAPIRHLLVNDVFASWLLERLTAKAVPMDKIISVHLITGVGDQLELSL